MTIKFVRAAHTFISADDSDNFTFPASDWAVSWVMVMDGLTTGSNPQYILSTGAYQASGSLNLVYQTDSGWIQLFADTNIFSGAFAKQLVAGGAYLFVLQKSDGVITLRSSPILASAPSDASSVTQQFSVTYDGHALNGSAFFIGGRSDFNADRYLDQSLARLFRYDGKITDMEVAQLAFGKEITDLGKTPYWYSRMNTSSDFANSGTSGNTFYKTNNPATGTSPGFGYTGSTPAPSVPAVSATPMTAERIYQRAGTTLAITMSGLWSVTKPDSIEYQLYAEDRTTVLMPWTAISNATINADGTWSGTPLVPQGGMYYRRVRAKSNGTVLATGDIETNLFGVGDLFGHTGSSSSSLLFTNESGTGFTPTANVRVYHNSNTTWARFGTDGAAIAMANALAAKAGVPVGFIAYGWGGTQLAQWLDKTGARWTSFSAAVANNGGKLAGVITTVGSNDANDGIVASRSSHLANLRQFFDNHRVLTSQPNLPILLTGFNRRPSANAQQSDWVRQAECIIGDDSSVYHVQVLDLELHTDLVHLSRTSTGGFRYSAERGGNVFGDAIYKGTYRRGPKIISFTYVGNKIYVDLQHRNGTDFTPSASINGFTVSDSSGSVSFTVARDLANRIVLTCTRALVGTVTVKYLSGSSPVSSTTAAPTNEVLDNGALALPMTMEAELVAVQASDTEVPIFSGTATAAATSNSANVSYPAATDNVAVAGYEYSLNNGSTWTATNSTATSFTLSNLESSTAYYGLVRAIDTSNLRSNALAFSFTTSAAAIVRTVTLPLWFDKDTRAANVTGIKLAAFDEPTPDLRNAPVYRTASAATDANGILTFTMLSMLSAGGRCGVSVQLADGSNFDVIATVA